MRVKASKFDEKFDRGKDVSAYLNVSRARRPGLEQRRVNVDFPAWMIEALDREGDRLGVTRQSLLKLWIAERLEQQASTPTVAELSERIRQRPKVRVRGSSASAVRQQRGV